MLSVTSANVDLQAKIRLILLHVSSKKPVYKIGTKEGTAPKPSLHADGSPPFVITDPSGVEMIQEQVGLLKALHGACSPQQRNAFPRLLCKEISESNALVVVLTLIHTGHLSHIMDALLNKTPAGQINLRNLTWYALRSALSLEPHRFTDDELTKLEQIQRRDSNWVRIKGKAMLRSAPLH